MPRTPPPTSPASSRQLLGAALRAGVRAAHSVRLGLGLVLIAGAIVAVLGSWGFAELAEQVREGTTQPFDERVLRRLEAIDAPWLDHAMLEITALANGLVVVVLAGVAAMLLWVTRHRYSAALLGAASAGGLLISSLLKLYFDRPRPQVAAWGTEVATSSFPSGHATSAAVVYVTVAYLAARLQRRRWTRWLTLVAAAVVVVLIAASRLFLGVHYPTDVAAGILVGLAWAAFCMALLEALHRFIRREAPAETANELPSPEGEAEGAAEAVAERATAGRVAPRPSWR